tara:strand:- start:3137 stop:4636 length:1500 start_codon:yes stop_codon:yes gene_type:complete
MNILWYKYDLRVTDHHPLVLANQSGPWAAIYIIEPMLWQEPDMSYRQYCFLASCLKDLDQQLRAIGQRLIIKVGEVEQVFSDLHQRYAISNVWAHEETKNSWTYSRDKKIRTWFKANHITFTECPHNGVVRRLKNRDGWAKQWYDQMYQPVIKRTDQSEAFTVHSDPIPLAEELNLQPDGIAVSLEGTRQKALQCLKSFLYQRGEHYTREMSSPVTAYTSCSRLSRYITYGVISMREVFHACTQRQQELNRLPPEHRGKWPNAMRSFASRLRWHCHFIQKLEDQPSIEYENMHRAYDTIRTMGEYPDRLQAWKNGQTGYPMIDACMRALIKEGWINFRMRAMLMSFASYHLWIDWRDSAPYLASLFVDYEPGIHYSQCQMQSGTTGINAIRIYNPIKQGIDQDPDGVFIRKWVKELSQAPSDEIHRPWEFENAYDYPAPIVDEKEARQHASKILYGMRKDQSHKAAAKEIVKKHASRKRPGRPKRPPKAKPSPQKEFEL